MYTMCPMQEQNFWIPNSRLVYPPSHPEVMDAVGFQEILHRPNPDLTHRQILKDQLQRSAIELREWLVKAVDTRSLDFAYPTAGITQALQIWLQNEQRQVYRLRGDYLYPSIVSPGIIVVDDVEQVPDSRDCILYLSVPSARDGNYPGFLEDLASKSFALALDCAYLGTAEIREIPIPENVDLLFYSFSKSFGLAPLRVGWLFSKNSISSLECLNEYGYVPAVNFKVTSAIVSEFPLDFCHQWLAEPQERICSEFGLARSDCALLAIGDLNKYGDFEREGLGFARVPLVELLETRA